MYQVGNIVNDNLQGRGVVIEITTDCIIIVKLDTGETNHYNYLDRNINSKSNVRKRTKVTTLG